MKNLKVAVKEILAEENWEADAERILKAKGATEDQISDAIMNIRMGVQEDSELVRDYLELFAKTEPEKFKKDVLSLLRSY